MEKEKQSSKKRNVKKWKRDLIAKSIECNTKGLALTSYVQSDIQNRIISQVSKLKPEEYNKYFCAEKTYDKY